MASINAENLLDIPKKWENSTTVQLSTLHQIGPYIGKMKPLIARTLISSFSCEGDTIYDPFCGSGTVALEAWTLGRKVIANDLNPYGRILTRAKLFPPKSLKEALNVIDETEQRVEKILHTIDLRKTPSWVRSFFHNETLREIIAWARVLKSQESFFLFSCLLGILHHQRPGFLSYPSSHSVPYLRSKKFPREKFPELYLYRPVRSRLEKKVTRALKNVPPLNYCILRKSYLEDSTKFRPVQNVQVIITSPPYMRNLDYARDNRLRLWLLGKYDWNSLDQVISPSEALFIDSMRKCFTIWSKILPREGLCVLVLGDNYSKTQSMSLPDLISHIARDEIGAFTEVWRHSEEIPNLRRVRRGYSGNKNETVLVLRNEL